MGAAGLQEAMDFVEDDSLSASSLLKDRMKAISAMFDEVAPHTHKHKHTQPGSTKSYKILYNQTTPYVNLDWERLNTNKCWY